MKFVRPFTIALLLTVTATHLHTQLPAKKVLTLNVAKKIAEAAEAEAIQTSSK